MKWSTAWAVSTTAMAILLFMNVSAWAQVGGSQAGAGYGLEMSGVVFEPYRDIPPFVVPKIQLDIGRKNNDNYLEFDAARAQAGESQATGEQTGGSQAATDQADSSQAAGGQTGGAKAGAGFDLEISGAAEIGGLPTSLSGSGGRAGFEQYRDIPSFVVPEIQLDIGRKKNDYYLEFEGTDVGQDDQNYQLRFGRRGLVDVEYEWDQIPHFFSNNTAATPYVTNNGNFTLSSKPASTAGADVRDWVNTTARSLDLSQENRLSKFRINFTPRPGWRFTGGFNYQSTEGKRAFGSLFGSSAGQYNITELAEPIDYETYNIDVGGEYAGKVWGKPWSVGLKYFNSLFYNQTSTLKWDNPINPGIGAACTDDAAYSNTAGTGPCRGQLDLYPDNRSHTIALSGGTALPAKTNFMGTFSYSWRLQDDSFLPFTVNTALAQPTISASDLGGDVRPLLLNLTFTNNYFKKLGVKAFYRFYDLDNKSTSVSLPGGYIRNDSSAVGSALQSAPYEYSKNNFGLSGSYKLFRSLTAKFEYLFENFHRSSSREVLTQNTNTFGPTLDYTPTPWLLIRGSYKRVLRDAPGYDAGRQVAIFVDSTPDDLREDRLDALRKYSQASRDDDRVRLFTQITPMDNLMFHVAFDFDNAYYGNSDVGRTSTVGYSPSVGINYRPWERVTLFGNYNWYQTNWYMTAMERNAQLGATGCPARDTQTPSNCPSSVWNSNGSNEVNTFDIGTDIVLIKDKLNLRIQYTYSYADSKIAASGNTTTGNTPAVDYPTVSSRWQEALTRLEYNFNKNITLKLAYYFNRFDSSDFGTDLMKTWMGDVDTGGSVQRSIFLGDNINKPYEAHSGYIGVRYTYKTK